jgi:hypothetical protein
MQPSNIGFLSGRKDSIVGQLFLCALSRSLILFSLGHRESSIHKLSASLRLSDCQREIRKLRTMAHVGAPWKSS